MLRTLVCMFIACASLLAAASARAEPPGATGIAYVRIDNAWKGFWPGDGEYVQYVVGGEAKPLSPERIMLKPKLAMMLAFADARQFGDGPNMLEAHRKWELDYWHRNVGEFEHRNRDDLAGGRNDLMVTEMNIPQEGGSIIRAYLIAVAGKGGVYVFSISPIAPQDDELVRKIIAGIKVEHKELNLPAEAEKIRAEGKKKPAQAKP